MKIMRAIKRGLKRCIERVTQSHYLTPTGIIPIKE